MRATPGAVRIVTGQLGGGKTVVCVSECVARSKAGWVVATNATLSLPGPGPLVPIRSFADVWELDLLDYPGAAGIMVFIDDAALWFPRGSSVSMSPVDQWAAIMLRKFRAELWLAVQHQSYLSARFLAIATHVMLCKKRGGSIKVSVWPAFAVGENLGKSRRAKPAARFRRSISGTVKATGYDTLEIISVGQALLQCESLLMAELLRRSEAGVSRRGAIAAVASRYGLSREAFLVQYRDPAGRKKLGEPTSASSALNGGGWS